MVTVANLEGDKPVTMAVAVKVRWWGIVRYVDGSVAPHHVGACRPKMIYRLHAIIATMIEHNLQG